MYEWMNSTLANLNQKEMLRLTIFSLSNTWCSWKHEVSADQLLNKVKPCGSQHGLRMTPTHSSVQSTSLDSIPSPKWLWLFTVYFPSIFPQFIWKDEYHKWKLIFFLGGGLYCPIGISPMGNSSCFPWGKLAATESHYPTYCTCWVF